MTLDTQDRRSLLALAGDASRLTRDLLAEGRRERSAPRSQIGRDIKLEEDVRSEALIRAFLTERSPFPILGEEGGWGGQAPTTNQPAWVVDPLDGSFNYHRGIPLYCVSIALCVGMTALLGAIYDPERDELFAGGPDLGLALNGVPVTATGVPGQILVTGFPSLADIEETSRAVGQRARDWTKIRMFGTSALALAWVAAGRLDGYAESGIQWWDVAAGLALVQGAGLRTVQVEAPRADAPLVLEVSVAR